MKGTFQQINNRYPDGVIIENKMKQQIQTTVNLHTYFSPFQTIKQINEHAVKPG